MGCNTSSLRFNVNLILSLEMLSSAQQMKKRTPVIKGLCSTQTQLLLRTRIKEEEGVPFQSQL